MSFNILVHKPNARSQFQPIDQTSALCLFDPKIAYEHLIDRSKLLQKNYIHDDREAVKYDQMVEESRAACQYIQDQANWRREEWEHARTVGQVLRDEDEGGDEEERGESVYEMLQRDEWERARTVGLVLRDEDEVGDEEDQEEGVYEMLQRDVEGDEYEREIEWTGNADVDGQGDVIGAFGGRLAAGRTPGELERYGERADGGMKLGTRFHRPDDPNSAAYGLSTTSWETDIKQQVARGPTGEGNAAGEVRTEADAGVYARARLAEETEETRGRSPEAAGEEEQRRRHRSPTPDWANEELIDAQDDLARVRAMRKQAMDRKLATKTEQIRVKKMLATLTAAFPELNGTVRVYTARQQNKRKAETLDADADDVDGRSQKRSRRDEGLPENKRAAVAAWHAHYRTALADPSTLAAFPAPPSWHCAACSREETGVRRLEACAHNIGAALAGLTRKELKTCKVLFHPDKFHVCAAEEKEAWRGMAEEVFVVAAKEAEWRARSVEVKMG